METAAPIFENVVQVVGFLKKAHEAYGMTGTDDR